MPIVEPHLYADTPIFREMLYEREGRFPGTPEGEEPLPEVELSTPVEPVQVVKLSERAVYKVTPIGPENLKPVSFIKG